MNFYKLDIRRFKYYAFYLFEKFKLSNIRKVYDKQYLIIHIPKTGGTSLLTSIYEEFPQSVVYPNYYELSILNNSKYLNTIDFIKLNKLKKITEKRSVVIGHYPIWIRKQFEKKPIIICFFREPVARTISELNHLKTHEKKYNKMSLEEILEQVPFVTRTQFNFMGLSIDDCSIEQIRKRMNKIDFVGLMEHYEESIKMMNTKFNFNMKTHHLNKIKKKSNLYIDENLKSRIKAECEQEKLIYDCALEKFKSQMKLYHD